MPIASINPATGQTLSTFQALSGAVVEEKLTLAQTAFRRHRKTSFRERGDLLLRAAAIVEEEAERFGALMTSEMGKTLSSAVGEAKKCATACRYYAEHGELHLTDEAIATNASRSFVRYQPLGAILAPSSTICSGASPAARGSAASNHKCTSRAP